MVSPVVPAKAVPGHNKIPTANDRNAKNARARVRLDLIDILYPGASTSRLKRYAAVPAPDMANLQSNDERTANRRENRPYGLFPYLSERIGQLSGEFGRHRRLVHPVIFRQHVFRHSERTKQYVPDRESTCKIGVAPLSQRRVSQTVKDRRADHVFQRAKGPVEIGVDKGRMERRERTHPQ